MQPSGKLKQRVAAKMQAGPSRRTFLSHSAAMGAAVIGGVSVSARSRAAGPGGAARKVVVGIMGTSRYASGGDGRGSHLAATLAKLPGVEVAYVCDVDRRHVDYAVDRVTKSIKSGARPPQGVGDFRRVLDDQSVDALVIAAPDHWHAPAAILACAAGKHVYVEKPCAHNAHEGELLAAASARHQRQVQHGTQRRTWPAMREAVDRIRAGEIGRIIQARCFYYSGRPTIGHGQPATPPDGFDWNLWQGPAPERPYQTNVVPYNWHWFWNWGTGELGNNGVHFIDQARWALGVDYPTRVSFSGGKYRYLDDDQETPDAGIASFEFGDKLLTWEYRSWSNRTALDPDCDVMFAGEKGFLVMKGGGYTIHDLKGAQVAKGSGESGDSTHLQNFIDAIRGDAALHAPIDEGVRSALLCNLGNIAFRTGRAVRLDPRTHRIVNDPEAAALWARPYRPGWEPRV